MSHAPTYVVASFHKNWLHRNIFVYVLRVPLYIACICRIVTWWGGPVVIESRSLGLLLPSLLWHCRLLSVGSFDVWPIKPVPDITYNVFSGTLNPTQSISFLCDDWATCLRYGCNVLQNRSTKGRLWVTVQQQWPQPTRSKDEDWTWSADEMDILRLMLRQRPSQNYTATRGLTERRLLNRYVLHIKLFLSVPLY